MVAFVNPSPCNACELHKYSNNPGISVAGPPDVDSIHYLFLGEAPSASDDLAGRPFSGSAGQKLAELLNVVGIDKMRCAVTNVLQCVPWKDMASRHGASGNLRTPSFNEIMGCQLRFIREIAYIQPKVIIALGKTPLNTLFQFTLDNNKSSLPISKQRGKVFEVVIDGKLYSVMPTFDPAHILRVPDHESVTKRDLLIAKQMVEGAFQPELPEGEIVMDTFRAIELINECIQEYKAGNIDRVDIDLETADLKYWKKHSRILGHSISWKKGEAYYIPVESHGVGAFFEDKSQDHFIDHERLKPYFRRLIETVPITNQNAKFDLGHLGYTYGVLPKKLAGDCMIQSQLIYGERRKNDHGLKSLLRDLLNYPDYEMKLGYMLKDILAKKKRKFKKDGITYPTTYAVLPLSILGRYALYDSEGALRLDTEKLGPLIKEKGLEQVYELSLQALLVFAHIEQNGIAIDKEVLPELWQEFSDLQGTNFYKLIQYPGAQAMIQQSGITEQRYNQIIGQYLNTPSSILDHFDELGFNPESSQQVAALFFDFMNIKFNDKWRTSTGGRGTDQKMVIPEILKEYGKESNVGKFIQCFLDYKSVSTTMKNYLGKIPKYIRPDRTIDTTYRIGGAATGRLTNSEFAIHTTPKEGKAPVKKLYVSRWRDEASQALSKVSGPPRQWWSSYPQKGGGLFLSVDYSSIELRVMAALSRDEVFIETFQKGLDPHRRTAALSFLPDRAKLQSWDWKKRTGIVEQFKVTHIWEEVAVQFNGDVPRTLEKFLQDENLYEELRYQSVTSKQRNQAKAINFGVGYGATEHRIAASSNMTVDEAREFMDNFFTTYSGLRRFIQWTHEYARAHGCIRMPNGRYRWAVNIRSQNQKERARAERQVQNAIIQGSASDLTLKSIILTQEAFWEKGFKSLIIGSVHDSVLFDIYPGELTKVVPVINYCMTQQVIEQPGYTWMQRCPIKVDFSLGTSWYSVVDISVDGDKVDVVGLVPRVYDLCALLRESYYPDLDLSNYEDFDDPDGRMRRISLDIPFVDPML